MKKMLLLATFMSGLLLAEMKISQNFELSKEIPNNSYKSNIQILGSQKLRETKNLSLEDKNSIIKTFNAINKQVLGDICMGGGFEINPFYEYKNNTKQQSGFETSYNLECNFNTQKEIETFNHYLKFIEKEVSNNKWLLFPIPKSENIATQESVKNFDKKLQEEILIQIMQKAKDYSKITQKKCSVQEVALGENDLSMPSPLMRKNSLMLGASSDVSLENISMPQDKKALRTLKAKAIFICK
ncbi:hypothetical protein [Helicobacter burdigaliensis]|uniref:hypothetical protein n=1 Tax=Helicobacter burdigaliensis TaxID=2315334 RepID=UPI000EF722EC|nr:hypothetical protein [Helicobacter burdigaliensis]